MHIFLGLTTLQTLPEIQNVMTETQCELEQLPGRIKDIVWEKGKQRNVYCEFCQCSRICKKIRARTLVISWAWIRKEWYGAHTYKPNGEWDRVAEDMMINFSESGHPVFRGSRSLERGNLRSKGKLSIHFCGDDETAEVVLRTIISVKELSVYGRSSSEYV